MRVVVTGGSGFIGAHVVDALVAAGHDVVVADQTPPRRSDVVYCAVDLQDLHSLVAATRGADIVFHLAAVADVNDVAAEPVRTTDLNVSGTARVWEACRLNGVRRAVLASTVWVYSGAAGQGSVDEDAAIRPSQAGHLYTSSKLAAEMIVHSYHTLYGQDFTILRYGIPYGPGMRDSLVIAKFVRMAREGQPITIDGDGSQYRNYVYVEDLAAAHVLALGDEAAGEVFNLEGTESVTIRRLVDAIGDALGHPLSVEYGAGRPGDYAGREVSAEKAARVLGWRPRVSFEAGLERYVQSEYTRAASAPVPATRPLRLAAASWLALVVMPLLLASGASLQGRLFALGGVFAGATTAWITSRRGRTFVPVAVTTTTLVTVVWLLSQTGPGFVSLVLGVLIGIGVGTSISAPLIRDRATARYVVAMVACLGIVAAVAPLNFAWVGLLLATVAGLGNARTRGFALTRRRRSWVMAVAALVVTALTTSWVGATSPHAEWFGSVVAHGPRSSSEVAITFDAPLDARETADILAALRSRGVSATFFATRESVAARPDVARSVELSGDLLASQASMRGVSWLDPRAGAVPRADDAFARGIGKCPSYFRPANGRHTPFMARVAHRRGEALVTWDVRASSDAHDDPQALMTRLLGEIKPGSIVAVDLHGAAMAADQPLLVALPHLLDALRDRGLQPVRLDTLLDGRGYRPCDAFSTSPRDQARARSTTS